MASERYPRGKLNAADEGAVSMGVTVKDGAVVLAFPKPVAWIGLGYDDAVALAQTLLRRAEEIRN